jgi:hypothetical protein
MMDETSLTERLARPEARSSDGGGGSRVMETRGDRGRLRTTKSSSDAGKVLLSTESSEDDESDSSDATFHTISSSESSKYTSEVVEERERDETMSKEDAEDMVGDVGMGEMDVIGVAMTAIFFKSEDAILDRFRSGVVDKAWVATRRWAGVGCNISTRTTRKERKRKGDGGGQEERS